MTLTEVLVAAVLLAIGVGGSLGSLLVAAQLRTRADAREAVAQAVEDRLSWFAASACTVASDTLVGASGGASVDERWRVTRVGSVARLEGRALARTGAHQVRRALVATRRCP